MIIKRKSLIVALISSFVIALVLVLTLAGYYIYLEYKGKEFKKHYQELLGKVKADVYSKYIVIGGLDAKIENSGALKGKPIIEGTVTNNSSKDIFNLAIKVTFVDKDNTAIYDIVFHPQEPTLGSNVANYAGIPDLKSPARTALKAGETSAFKKIMSQCPTEIFIELREGDKPKKNFGKWSGKLTAQVASMDF